jgi:hypothetical protein
MEIEVEKETIADTFNTYHGGRPSVRIDFSAIQIVDRLLPSLPHHQKFSVSPVTDELLSYCC